MSKAIAKTINFLLYDGDLSGVLKIEDESWTHSGILYNFPRNSLDKLFSTNALNNPGVYLLLSKTKVFVGNTSDLSHDSNKHVFLDDWWTSILILSSSKGKLNNTDVNYIESVLIQKAKSIDYLYYESTNKNSIVIPEEFKKVVLDQFIEDALFYMELIGIKLFKNKKEDNAVFYDTSSIVSKLCYGRRAKTEAIKFLKGKGVPLPASKDINYATKQPESMEYWINPKTSQLEKDWILILNNTNIRELIILRIPKNTFHLSNSTGNGLITRTDNDTLINLRIDVDTFIDITSDTNFSSFITDTFSYGT